jgi:endonuclease-8
MPYPEAKGALRLRMWTRARRGVQGEWLELRGPSDCSIFSDAEWAKLEARIGPDPLNAGADAKQMPGALVAVIGKKKTPIGVVLMDQSVVSGIGNIYRAELLYRARIHPDRPGKDVRVAELHAIWRDAVMLMQEGMEDRRMVTTLPEDRPHVRGRALDEEVHYVYRRQGKACRVCATEIEAKPMAGRTVYWCPGCQAA